ncbi:MAG: branched-chain amino acid ABC transporter ATP-binding protein [Candidatus Methanomethylicota archaeon]|uniref:Branched-chain amino acid ABC transporter ATP-binding protein n=1 Tax=Thermoproteota archaeon TaxID=2056631 RepID=A0A497EWG2_9CREN|nr:MAG: branched-chain amino acid ABC transporter ATP-binding protein [Candidatus Verstraetearchaeota archaeon]
MLEVKDITVGYGELVILRDISIKVDNGEFVAVIGSNGAGKTTLLKTISGLLKPRKGQIIYNGTRIDELPPHEIANLGVIYIPEGRRPFPYLTVKENLELGAYGRRARERINENLEFVYQLFPILKERSNQLAITLSGGEQQMLAIARGLMASPEVMMLDEPSLGLAPKIAARIFNVIKKLHEEEKLTILLVEQNARKALELADRAYVLETGRIVLEGTGGELLNNEHVKKAYLGL